MGDILKPGLWNMDCMEGMAGFGDGFFDLAIVDPPYGGGGARDVDNFKPVLSGGGATGHPSPAGASGGCLTATISAARTGGTWAAKYQDPRRAARRFATGTSRRRGNTSTSWPG